MASGDDTVVALQPEHGQVIRALAELRKGRPVLVVDDEDRENEGDLILAAEFATPASIAFLIRHTSGIVCVALPDEDADRLGLPLMVEHGEDPRQTAFTVSVDLRRGITTGVSAVDRAATVAALADPATLSTDIVRPGHVFPLRARAGGVLKRAGHTESAIDLCRLAGLRPAGVLAELTNDDGTMTRGVDVRRFAEEHDLVLLSVADLVRHRTGSLVRRAADGRLPTEHGEFTAVSYVSELDGIEHVALVLGDVDQRHGNAAPVLVRVHSECLTGDVFGSRRCDCGEQLEAAVARIGKAGRGVVVYLRGHEGRGIGLSHKLRAYRLQDTGLDTVDANLVQGLPADSRDYGIGALILRDLGVQEVRLMTNNPAKYRGLAGHGIRIAIREQIVTTPNPENVAYLETKRKRFGHTLGELEAR